MAFVGARVLQCTEGERLHAFALQCAEKEIACVLNCMRAETLIKYATATDLHINKNPPKMPQDAPQDT